MDGFQDGFQAGHLIAQDTMDLFNTGYNVYQDQRNYNFQKGVFDYQKALQQDIFNREDTAVQRRRRDLEAAGLNPNLAAGSAAGAGAVVGTSGGPGDHNISRANFLQNYGAYLDAKKAAEEAKQAEVATRILERKDRQDKRNQETQNTLDAITNLYNSGADVSSLYVFQTQEGDGYHINLHKAAKLKRYLKENVNNIDWTIHQSEDGKGGYGQDSYGNYYSFKPLVDTKFWKALQNGWKLELNALAQSNFDTSMLAREEEWQTSDKWLDRGLRIWDRITNSGSALGNMIRAVRPNKKPMRKSSTTFGKGFRNTTFEY